MFLVVIGVLSVVLALREPLPGWLLAPDPGATILAVALATLAPPMFAWWLARRSLAELEDHSEDPARGQERFGRGSHVTQGLLAACHVGVLTTTGWMHMCNSTPVIGRWPMVGGILAMVPFIASLLLVWVVVFPTDRAIRQIALEQFLFRGRPVRPVWPMGRYLAYNLRHQLLFVLIPSLLILLARDVIDIYDGLLKRRHPHLPDILLGTVAGVVALFAPVMLRYVWVTQPLADGPLRDRLLLLCRRLHLRCREILVWRSGGMIVNAAVMGLFAPLRYVLITDAMLEQMDDTKIEAVFGHEAGHIKHHHILFFLMIALLTGCLVSIVAVYANDPKAGGRFQEVGFAATGLVLLLKWTFGFGWVSRRFEREADIFGVRTLALLNVPCAGNCRLHDGQNPPADARRGPLCATAAAIFGDTLNDVAHLNGIPPDARGLRHPSISARSRFVQAVASDPAALRRFRNGILATKCGIFLLTAAACCFAAYKLKVWTLLDVRWL